MFDITSEEGQKELNSIVNQINEIISGFENKYSVPDKEIVTTLRINTFIPGIHDEPFNGVKYEIFVIDHKALKEQNNG